MHIAVLGLTVATALRVMAGEQTAQAPTPTLQPANSAATAGTNLATQASPGVPPASVAAVPQSKTNLGPPGNYVSPWLSDVLKLFQAGIDESVIMTFVDSAGTFNLDAEQIIYLKDTSFPPPLISAMMQHDMEIISGVRAAPVAPSLSAPGLRLPWAHPEPALASSKTSTNSEAAPPELAAAEPESIVNHASPDLAEDIQNWEITEQALSQRDQVDARAQLVPHETPALTHLTAAVSPVRQPYPVQLTRPILIIPAQGRPPNLLVIQMSP